MSFLLRALKTEHENVQELFSAYLDGEVTGREKEHVERHLRECPDCRRRFQEMRQTVRLLHGLPEMPLPYNFTFGPSQLYPNIRVPQPSGPPKRSWAYPLLGGATALAATLLIVVLAFDLLLSSPQAGTAVPVARKAQEQPAAEVAKDEAELREGERAAPSPTSAAALYALATLPLKATGLPLPTQPAQEKQQVQATEPAANLALAGAAPSEQTAAPASSLPTATASPAKKMALPAAPPAPEPQQEEPPPTEADEAPLMALGGGPPQQPVETPSPPALVYQAEAVPSPLPQTATPEGKPQATGQPPSSAAPLPTARLAEIGLAALALLLAAATLWVRKGQRK